MCSLEHRDLNAEVLGGHILGTDDLLRKGGEESDSLGRSHHLSNTAASARSGMWPSLFPVIPIR